MSPIGPMPPLRRLAFLAVLLLLMLTSCERYEIELYYTGKADVHVNIDWQSRFKERPTGMTLMLAKDSDAITFTDISNDVDHYDLELEPGTYKMLIMNQTFGEFGSMSFAQTKSFNDIFALARQQQRTTDFWDVNVSYMREPEHIGCVVDTFTVLPEMTDGDFRFVNYKEKIRNDREHLTFNEVVDSMETEMFIRVRVIGMKYMSNVIGSISGMADGFLLSQAWRRPQAGYHLLDNWQRSAITYENGDSLKNVGYISTTIRTFGLPHGRELNEQRDSNSNVLSLCFTLIDDRQIVFRYPVGKMIKYRNAQVEARANSGDSDGNGSTRGYDIDADLYMDGRFRRTDVTLELDLIVDAPFYDDDEVPILPYAQPKGTGAFDAEVAPWGDEEHVDVPM